MYHIFLIEDDEKLQDLISDYLMKYNFRVSCVEDFQNIEEEFKRNQPDLVLLDLNLPYYDGFYLCRAFRKVSHIPIIIVSARSSEMEQIMGIELGADDYVIKPLKLDVLHAKIKAQLRRNYGEFSANNNKTLTVHGLTLDESSFKMSFSNDSIELSKNEFKLLKCLLESHNQFIRREDLLETLWDDQTFVDENTLTVNVSRVKQRLKEIGIRDAVKTKRGVGYKLTLDRRDDW